MTGPAPLPLNLPVLVEIEGSRFWTLTSAYRHAVHLGKCHVTERTFLRRLRAGVSTWDELGKAADRQHRLAGRRGGEATRERAAENHEEIHAACLRVDARKRAIAAAAEEDEE